MIPISPGMVSTMFIKQKKNKFRSQSLAHLKLLSATIATVSCYSFDIVNRKQFVLGFQFKNSYPAKTQLLSATEMFDTDLTVLFIIGL